MKCDEWEEFIKKVKPLKKKNEIDLSFSKVIKKNDQENVFVRKIAEQLRSKHPFLSVRYYSLREVPDFRGPSLDLHGLTLTQAERALLHFLNSKKGWVLLITGKGMVLREWFVRWAYDHPEYLIGFTQAAPKHGGGGAFYLCIRKEKI
jgi:hypothetical protein